MKRSRKFLAIILVIVMLLGIMPFSASAEMQPGLIGLSRRAAAEGIVMLQNDNNVLPLDSSRTVSVFGRVQYNYFYCGYGSGGDVKYPYSTNLLEGMRRNPGITVNETLAKIYESWCKKNVPNDGSWGNWPTCYAEMSLTDEQVSDAADVSDTAVVVIGRSAGEDRESTLTKGSYYLTDLETDMLDKVTAAFDKIVVVLAVGNIIDMGWVDRYPQIDSILYAWQGGMESGPAVADILSGDESPSGKLAATIAYEYTDYPSSESFGTWDYANYVEDIFVGYRYFETFAQDRVRYGFGYGLSYTDFEINTTNVTENDDEITIDVTVTNTGDYKGKEVVQVYYGAPQGELGKASKSLIAYAKTNLLQPGDSEDIRLSFKIDDMSSYDDAGKTGYKSAWLMEAGDYPIYVGNSVRDSREVYKYTESDLRVTEQLSEAGAVYPAENAFARWTASEVDGQIVLDKETDMTPTRTIDLKEKILSNLPEEYEIDGVDRGYKLVDVYEDNCTMEEFIKQMTVEDLANLTRGAGGMGDSAGISGNASVYGGVTTRLRDTLGIPAMSTTDGPSGIRMTASATLLPIGTTLACTWNDRLIEDLYAGVGAEMVLNGSDCLLAPGMNLQRDPLCGRNFEYFSEDPVLTGQMGSNVVRGVQSQGVSATPKHYACNNQETNRNYNDSRLSERALREIYLKGFEICVKTAKPQNIMTSYNKINSVWGHYNYELDTVILREQWGYKGCVMTDWWMSSDTDPDFGLQDNAYRVRAQIDVLMPGEGYRNGDPVAAYEADILTLGEIQRSAINVLNFALKSAKFRQDNSLPLYDYEPGEPAFEVVQDVQGKPEINAIYLDGVLVEGFTPLTTEYIFYKKDFTSFPVVTADADADVEIIQATSDSACATVYARTADGGQTVYRIYWTNQAGMTPTVPNPVYARLTNIYVNGEPMLDFYQDLYSYTVWVEDSDDVEITADTPDGVEYSVTRDGDVFTIRAESEHQAMEYILILDYYVPVPEERLPKSDDFGGTELKDFWTVDNQTEMFSKEDGSVRIITEGGDWYQTATDQKNTVWQYAYGDWTSVTKVDYNTRPDRNYQQMGVVVFDDNDNWVQWRMEYNTWGSNLQISMNTQVNGSNKSIGTTTTGLAELPETDGTFYLKVVKRSDTYTVSYSPDGDNWYAPSDNSAAISLSEPKFGIFAISGNSGNDDNPRITVDFDYVDFTDVSQPGQNPPAPVPVVDIAAAGTSKVKLAADKFYMSPGLQTERTGDEDGGENVGYTSAGKFMLVNINVEKAGYYNLASRYAAAAAVDSLEQISYSVHVDGARIATFNVRGTGGWQNWSTTEPAVVYLEEGLHKLMFHCDTGSFNINWLQFERVADVADKSALTELYSSARGEDSSKYTEASWEAVENALAEAKATLDDESATQDAVDAVYAKLQDAIDGLVEKISELEKEATPNASIDYVSEQLTGLAAGTYTINGEAVNVTGTTCDIQEKWMGTTLNIVRKGNNTTTVDSDPQKLSVPAHPAAPKISGVNETYGGRHDGKITGVTTDMEYSSGGSSWTSCTGTEITGLASGMYLVRYKAVAGSSFASADTAWIIRSDSDTKTFKDVKAGDWFYDAVQYVNSKGIMIGTSDDTFEPEFKLNRATVVMVLYRMDGEPDVAYSPEFKDVPDGKWYSEAVIWAAKNKIVEGYGGNMFGPEDNVTREQFATMMYRYAKYKNYDISVPPSFSLSKYSDAGKVSDWAKDAMSWCVYNELITGVTDTALEPANTATRAQCATIFQRYTENIAG